MHAFEYEWLADDGVRLCGRKWQPADDSVAAVAIVHGLGEHGGRYAEIASQFVAAGFAVWAFDQRGHGRSAGPRGHAASCERLLDDIAEFVRRAGQERTGRLVILYGHSMGGNLVLNYALRRAPQLAGLIVTSPLLCPVSPPGPGKQLVGRLLSRWWPTCSFDIGVNPDDLSHDRQAVDAYRTDPLVHHRVSARLGTQLLDAGVWAIAHADRLKLPTLLMHGSGDKVTSSEASREFARRAGPLCNLQIWNGLYHELHWESERTEVIRHAIDWMHRTIAGGRDTSN